MRKIITMVIGLLLVSAASTFAACGTCPGAKPAADSAKQMRCNSMEVYVCTMCKTGALAAGKCAKCAMDLVKMHVLACADGMVSLCSCKGDCKCTIKADAAKCSCGKDVVKIAMKDIPGCGACPKLAPATAVPPPAKVN
ncbi:MAG: hypothetical protein WCL16_05350 [bacterium]